MGMVVRSNVMAVNAFRQLGMNNNQVSKSLEKLSSGYRINRAGDDASGLAISEKMKAQIKGLETASTNSQDGISLIQTAEGALTEVHDMLNRMVELAGKAANGTMDDPVDRQALQKELDALKSEINRIADGTNFNGLSLLNGSLGAGRTAQAGEFTETGTALADNGVASIDLSGVTANLSGDLQVKATDNTGTWTLEVTLGGKSFTFATWDGTSTSVTLTSADSGTIQLNVADATTLKGVTTAESLGTVAEGSDAIEGSDGLTLQIGDTSDDFNKITVSINDMSTTGLDIADISIATQEDASAALDAIKKGANSAINTVSSVRADLGAMQNRLEHTINNLDVAAENMTSANSRIRDTDMAKQMMEYTKMNVLTQAAQAMLAQANQQPQSVLQLLQ